MGAAASCEVRDHIIAGRGDGISSHLVSMFVDNEFALDLGIKYDNEVCDLGQGSSAAEIQPEIEWIRASKLGCGALFTGIRDPCVDDIVPGVYSDACFVAAAMALTRSTNYLKGHFVGYNPYIGCATVRLWHNSRYEVVVVDDKIPCFKDPDSGIYIPVFTYTLHGECWVALLEKAWAKLRGGSYSNFGGISMSDMLVDLTGEYVVDAELEGDVVSSDYIATSAHTAHTVNSTATPQTNHPRFAAANERNTVLGDRKTMYDDLFNILLSRSVTGNTLICADPVSTIYNNEYNCDHRGNKVDHYAKNIGGDVAVGAVGGIQNSGMMDSASFEEAGYGDRVNVNDPPVYPCVVLGVVQKKRPPRPATVTFADNFSAPGNDTAATLSRSKTGGVAVVHNNTAIKRSESFRNVALEAEDVSDLRFVRIATIASRENLVAKQRTDATSGANWSQWADGAFATQDMATTGVRTVPGTATIPEVVARARSAVAPVPPTALMKTMSNHNKLTHIPNPNDPASDHIYRKVTGVLENTAGTVEELPVPPDETLSQWIPWRDFLRRYRVLSVCCLLSMQATKPASMGITNPGSLLNSYEAVQGWWHNTDYDAGQGSTGTALGLPVGAEAGAEAGAPPSEGSRNASVTSGNSVSGRKTSVTMDNACGSTAGVSAPASVVSLGGSAAGGSTASVGNGSVPETGSAQLEAEERTDSQSGRFTPSVAASGLGSFDPSNAPTATPAITCGGSYHSCSFRQNQMYHLPLPKGTVSRQACRLYISLHTPDALMPSADSLLLSATIQQQNPLNTSSPDFNPSCSRNDFDDDGNSVNPSNLGGSFVVAPEYPVRHAGGINSPELFPGGAGSIYYSTMDGDTREREAGYGADGAKRTHQVHSYVPIALSIYKFEPMMRTLLAQTVYRNSKSICIELDVNADNTELLVIPSTYHPNILHGRFWLTASLITLSTGVITSLPLRLHTDWPLYPYSTPMLRNKWCPGKGTAQGRIGLCTPFSFKNPCYRVKCYMNAGSNTTLKESVRLIVVLAHHKTTGMNDVSKLTSDFVAPPIPLSSSYRGVVGVPNHYQLKHIMTLHNSPSMRATGRPQLTPYDALSVVSCVNNSKSDGSLTGKFNTNTNAAAEDNVLFHRIGCYILTHDAYSELCVNKGLLKRYEDGIIGSMAFNVGRECVRSETLTPARTYSVSCPYDPDIVDVVIMPCTWFPGHSGEFMLQIMCDCPCEIFEV